MEKTDKLADASDNAEVVIVPLQLMDTSDGWLNVSENNQRIKPLN
jgi:hypothetical protein